MMWSWVLGSSAMGFCKAGCRFINTRQIDFLSLAQNLLMGFKLSGYHTGFRAFDSKVLRELPLDGNSDDLVFDNELISQVIFFRFRVGEISFPTRYFAEASSINFSRSVKYGFGVLATALRFRLQKMRIPSRIFMHGESKLPKRIL